MQEDNIMRGIKRMTLEAQIIRADGSTEDQGVVAVYDSDPLEMERLMASGLGEVKITEASCE